MESSLLQKVHTWSQAMLWSRISASFYPYVESVLFSEPVLWWRQWAADFISQPQVMMLSVDAASWRQASCPIKTQTPQNKC